MSRPRTCRIDAARISGVGEVHDKLAADLGFPPHYGRNLDALWDVLTGDLAGPAEIEIANAGAAAARLGPGFRALLDTLREAALENDALRVVLL